MQCSGEMTQFIKCLMCKHQDASSNPQTHVKKQTNKQTNQAYNTPVTVAGGVGIVDPWNLAAIISESVSFSFRKRLYHKALS